MKNTFKLPTNWIVFLLIWCFNTLQAQHYHHVYDLPNSTQLAIANTRCEDQRMTFVGYYLAEGNGEEDPNGQTFVMKTEEDGTKVWERRYGFDGGDLYPTNIYYTQDEGFIISGVVFQGNYSKGFLLKINHDGSQNWLKSYESQYTSIGTFNYTGNQAIDHVEQDFAGNYIAIGASYDPPYKMNILKIDGYGQVQKDKSYTYNDVPQEMKIKPLEDGSYLVIASFTEDSRVWLLDADLNILWERKISLQGTSDYIWTRDLVIQENDRFVITGGSTIDKHWGGNSIHYYYAFLITMDFGGNKVSERSYRWFNSPSNCMGMSIEKDDAGNMFVGGSVEYATLTGYDPYGYPTYSVDNQAFVLKTSSSGNAFWVGDYGKPNTYENALEIIVHPPGEWVAVGHRGFPDYRSYLVKGNPDGDTPCDMHMHFPVDTTLHYQISSINTSAAYHLVSTLSHPDLSQGFQNLGKDCGGQTVQVRAAPRGDKLSPKPFEMIHQEKVVVIPNPSQGSFEIRMTNKHFGEETIIELYRINGKLVSKRASRDLTIQYDNLDAGTYVAKIIHDDRLSTKRIVIR